MEEEGTLFYSFLIFLLFFFNFTRFGQTGTKIIWQKSIELLFSPGILEYYLSKSLSRLKQLRLFQSKLLSPQNYFSEVLLSLHSQLVSTKTLKLLGIISAKIINHSLYSCSRCCPTALKQSKSSNFFPEQQRKIHLQKCSST